jgi:hypothetical protein
MPDAFLLKTKADAELWLLEEMGVKAAGRENPIVPPKEYRFPEERAFDAELWPTDVPIPPDRWGKVSSLITDNHKLQCPSFSLPSIWTCHGSKESIAITESKKIPGTEEYGPGRIGICTGCYARKGQFAMGDVPSAMSLRYQFAGRTQDFVDTMVEAIRLSPSIDPGTGKTRSQVYGKRLRSIKASERRYFRIHASGDFFSTAYIRAWIDIVDASPFVLFWAPTRVWKLRQFLNDLRTLAGRFNATIRPSAMAFDDLPPKISGLHAGSTSHFDPSLQTKGAKAVLREYNGKFNPNIHEKLKRNGVFVCPAIAEKTCTRSVNPQGTMPCRTCWLDKDRPVTYPAH